MPPTLDRDHSVATRKNKSDKKTDRVEVAVTEEWRETFEEEAKRWGLDLSSYIRLACEEKRRRDRIGQPDAD
jgi:hypothetical protein